MLKIQRFSFSMTQPLQTPTREHAKHTRPRREYRIALRTTQQVVVERQACVILQDTPAPTPHLRMSLPLAKTSRGDATGQPSVCYYSRVHHTSHHSPSAEESSPCQDQQRGRYRPTAWDNRTGVSFSGVPR